MDRSSRGRRSPRRAKDVIDPEVLAETQRLCDEWGREVESRFPGFWPESPQPAPADTPAGQERLQRAARWLDDLMWHKRMYRPARFRWWPEHLIDICTKTTGGQLDFTTVAHLEQLQEHRSTLWEVGLQFGGAMGERLADAYMTIGSYERIAEELQLTMIDIRSMVAWSYAENAPPEGWTHPGIRWVLRVVGRQPFRNPLIEVWELSQQERMYQAAADIFEDLTVDLIGELRGRRTDEVLAVASRSGTVERMERRIQRAHDKRGGPGDPRRYPNQFSTGPARPPSPPRS